MAKTKASPCIGVPSATLRLFVSALPSFVEGNNEPACLKFFLHFYIMMCFILFHSTLRKGWENGISGQHDNAICVLKSTEVQKGEGEVSVGR